MKKYLSLFAAASAILFSSYTTSGTLVSFHFIPANGHEIYYESAIRWEVAASHNECDNNGYDVCILRVDENAIFWYPGTQTQQLAAYLAAQGSSSWDYSSATDAVASLTFSTKP